VDLTKIPVSKFLIQQIEKKLLPKRFHIFLILEMEMQVIDYVHQIINLDQQNVKESNIQEIMAISLARMKKKVI